MRTSYPDGDREYLDGEVVERNIGDYDHSAALAVLCTYLGESRGPLGLSVFPSCRLRITGTRYRVPDITVMRRPYRANGGALIDTPFLIVEILSRDDNWRDTFQPFRDYEGLSVPHIVMIDPEDGDSWVYSKGNLLHPESAGFEVPGCGVLPFNRDALQARMAQELVN